MYSVSREPLSRNCEAESVRAYTYRYIPPLKFMSLSVSVIKKILITQI